MNILFAFGSVYAITWMMNNASQKMGGDKYKFEVKKAEDIK